MIFIVNLAQLSNAAQMNITLIARTHAVTDAISLRNVYRNLIVIQEMTRNIFITK